MKHGFPETSRDAPDLERLAFERVRFVREGVAAVASYEGGNLNVCERRCS